MKKCKSFFKFTALAAALVTLSSQAAVRTDLLSDVRSQIVFNELNQNDKKLLAEQAQLLLKELYVNQHAKNLYYGISPTVNGHVDPVTAVKEVVKNIENLTTTEVHYQLSSIFTSQRDLHLNYNFPLPHSNYMSFIPVSFTRVDDGSDFHQVRIDRIYKGFTDRFVTDQRVPSVGDIVIEYNGQPIKDAAESKYTTAGGANEFAGFSRALQRLTFIPQRAEAAPEENHIVLKLRSAVTGEEYTTQLPWLNQWNDAVGSQDNSASNAVVPATPTNAMVSQSEELLQRDFNKFISQNNLNNQSYFNTTPTVEPSITWSIVPKGDKNVGYIKLATFAPAGGFEQPLEVITNLLHNELASTDALVIDVRNNGGGYINYADMLPQMFIPGQAKVNSARFINTEGNRYIMGDTIFGVVWPEWAELMTNVTGTNERYSQTHVFTSPIDANAIGQVYYKPVGVLANARSYSATDLFTCAMQDNGAATIYGEDPKTGAGGANVLNQSLFATYARGPFKALPDGVSMRVSWRQSVRDGYNAGTIIEDHGCNADINVSQTPNDLNTGGLDQFNTITDNLLNKPSTKAYYQMNAHSERELNLIESNQSVVIEVAETERVNVAINGVAYEKHNVYAYGTAKQLTIELPQANAGQSYQLTITGVDGGNTALWNTKRTVTVN